MSWEPEIDEIRRRVELAKQMGGGWVAAGQQVQAGDLLLTIAG